MSSSDKTLFRHDDVHGHGDLHFVWQTGGAPLYLCTTGSDGSVAIFNRQGVLQERIVMHNLCCSLAWDVDGDVLALLTLNSSQITLWDANSQKRQTLDSGLRDNLSCLVWSKRAPILAIGTARGNLTIYNHQTTKRIPIIGKHSKRILCGAWSTESILALGSDDKSLSLSNEEGDTLKVVTLRDIPSDMQFAEMKTDERLPGENTISMILGRRTLFLYHLHEPDSPTELGFQNRYGQLVQHKWFGDGYILLGFGNGYLVSISTHPKEVGQELWQVKNHRDSLTGIAICQELEQVASCGDNTIKIHAMGNLQETQTILNLSEQTGIKSIEWSSDGQLLAASTTQGAICVFITQLCSLHAVFPPRIAVLSSLAEVSLYQFIADRPRYQDNDLQLEIEPSFLGVGPRHLACGMNNHIWFYDLGLNLKDEPMLLGDREYMNEVKKVDLNSNYAAVLSGGNVLLHPIDGHNLDQEKIEPKLFPSEIAGIEDALITCSRLTNNFLIFATDIGHIVFFSIEQWSVVTQHRHSMGIKNIFSDFDGSKIILIDDHNQGYVYSAAFKDFILIPEFAKTFAGAIWDLANPNVFVLFDSKICAIFIFIQHSILGRHVEKVGEFTISAEQTPILLQDGELCIAISGGKLTTIRLITHYYNGVDDKEQLKNFKVLRRYDDAWKICKRMDDCDKEWHLIALQAIEDLNCEFALKAFRTIGDAAMVMALEDLRSIEDINLLSGYCAMFLERIDEAKSFFADSIDPHEALQLCRDLMQCEQALALATGLSPGQVPFIARDYAQQLEFTGSYSEALVNYEKGLIIENDSKERSIPEHIQICKSGIARMSIKTGDYRIGIKLAREINDKQLYTECSEGLLSAGYYQEAAELYEISENWDKACECYIQQKNWKKVADILPNVISLKLHVVYAKAKETEGQYKEAINSYTIAGDMDSVVRIYLEQMSDPHSAGEIVMETKSIEGSKMLARFFQKIGDYESTIQYYIICGSFTEAFNLAQKHNKLKFYAALLEQSDATRPGDFLVLAQHFENEKYTLLAGKYYFLAKEYTKGLKHLLKASAFSNEENNALALAVDCVATSNDEKLATELIEYLLGESDGVPKDPKLLFRLYMARKQYKEAAKTAVIIANQEQVNGNYKVAHELLFSLYQELRRNQLTIASDLRYNLILLHRYILVRIHIKLGDHLLAAKLLVQIAENISQFPSHIVPILTSTVIECQRAGLKKHAFSYAVMLMRPEFRNQMDQKYSKKIETIVRKAPRDIKTVEDDADDTTECPVCDTSFRSMEITCGQCKTTLPICIATGQHIIKKNVAACPECHFLCIKSEMIKILNEINSCPMCNETVDSNRLIDIDDIDKFITSI